MSIIPPKEIDANQEGPQTPVQPATPDHAMEDLMVELLTEEAKQQEATETVPEEGQTESDSTAPRDTTVQRLSKLSVGEKVRLALFGSKEERFILIKSVNRIIAGAVLKSPKTTDAEIELISQMRNVHLDVLSTIAQTPGWAKKRTIALNLIRNPRTPVALALRLLRQVSPRDLQNISRDRGIPEVVRRTAMRTLTTAKRDK